MKRSKDPLGSFFSARNLLPVNKKTTATNVVCLPDQELPTLFPKVTGLVSTDTKYCPSSVAAVRPPLQDS